MDKRDYTVKSMRDFVDTINEIYSIEKTELWYRGQRMLSRHLDPSLYRGGLCYETTDNYGATIEPIYKTFNLKGQTVRFPDQFYMLERFKTEIMKQRLEPYPYMNDIEWLCFAQHCGMPTSLLDWSEDPMIGLYFAVNKIKLPIEEQNQHEEALVFILNPSVLNKNSTIWSKDENGGRVDIAEPIYISEDNYRTFIEYSKGHNLPVCIKPRKMGYRMCRQSGNFLLYGTDVRPLDMFPVNALNQFMYRIHIPYTSVEGISNSLKAFNITETAVYGDDPKLDDAGKAAKDVGKQQIKNIIEEIMNEINEKRK